MKNIIMTLTFIVIGLLLSPKLFAGGPTGNVEVTGPSSCGPAIVSFAPSTNTYQATTDFSAAGCVYFEWLIVGGVEATTGQSLVRSFESQTCLDLNGGPGIVANSATFDQIDIIWTLGANERSISVRMFQDGGFMFSNAGDLLIEKVYAPTNITRSTNCGDEHTVSMPSGSDDCQPNAFQWFVDGSFIGQTSGNSLNYQVPDPYSNYTVSVNVIYDGTVRGFARTLSNALDPKSILGPNIICSESTNAFSISFDTNPSILPTSVQWQSSTSAVTFTNPNGISTDLVVSPIAPTSFTLSCTTVTCGASDVQMRTIQIYPAGDINCPPIELGNPNTGELADQVRGNQGTTPEETVSSSQAASTLLDAFRDAPQSIYPNPVKLGNQLYLPLDCPTTAFTNVEIMDITGKMVSRFQNMDALNNNIPTDEISVPGNYMVRVGNDCGVKTYKVVVTQ